MCMYIYTCVYAYICSAILPVPTCVHTHVHRCICLCIYTHTHTELRDTFVGVEGSFPKKKVDD